MGWTAATYNPQAITPKRTMRMVLHALGATIIALPGTRMAPEADPGSVPMRWETSKLQTIDDYNVLSWTRPADAAPNACRASALPYAVKRMLVQCVRRQESASGELQGRGGFVRLRRHGVCDLGTFGLFFPSSKGKAGCDLYAKLVAWAEKITASLPSRCQVVVLTDANAHVGSIEGTSAAGSVMLGHWGSQNESKNGALLRQLACNCDLQIISTLQQCGSGVTWSAGRSVATRIEYIFVSAS